MEQGLVQIAETELKVASWEHSMMVAIRTGRRKDMFMTALTTTDIIDVHSKLGFWLRVLTSGAIHPPESSCSAVSRNTLLAMSNAHSPRRDFGSGPWEEKAEDSSLGVRSAWQNPNQEQSGSASSARRNHMLYAFLGIRRR